MKLIFALIIFVGSVNSFAKETTKVTCTLSQGYLSGKVIYTLSVDVNSKVPNYINPQQFSVDSARFSGVALDGFVHTEVIVDGNKIIGSTGLESSVSLLRVNQEPLSLKCFVN